MIPGFILVDDDRINNFLSREIIEMVFPEADVEIFNDAEIALTYVKSIYAQKNAPEAVLFLDINMPKITGWQFLDAFELFDPSVKERLNIYVLSSSIDRRDIDRAARNENVLDYIEKPLSTEILEKLLSRFSF